MQPFPLAAGGQGRIRTDFLSLCLRVCFLKHLPPISPPPGWMAVLS